MIDEFSKPPPEYTVKHHHDGEPPYSIEANDYRWATEAEAVMACWKHRGRIRQDAGLCPWHDEPEFGCEPCAELLVKAGKARTESYNHGRAYERAAIVAFLLDEEVVPELCPRIQRGDHAPGAANLFARRDHEQQVSPRCCGRALGEAVICLRCWRDAAAGPDGHYPNGCRSQTERYGQLLDERTGSPCTPEQQAGEYWDGERDSRLAERR